MADETPNLRGIKEADDALFCARDYGGISRAGFTNVHSIGDSIYGNVAFDFSATPDVVVGPKLDGTHGIMNTEDIAAFLERYKKEATP